MSRLDELIKEKCPNGVERKMLADLEDAGVITLGRGKVISKKDIQDNPGEYPIYSSSAVGSGLLGTYGDYMFEDVRLSWSIDGGGKFFFRDAPKYSVTNVCGWLTVNKPEVLDIKYLYFALSNEWSKKVFDYVHKAHPSVIRKEYTIPVPPLEIQQEIVGMLNSFTELEAELTKRKQQYEHYRGHLLSFENIAGEGGQVEWLALEEVAKIKNGSGYKDFSDGPYPVYGTGGIMTKVDRYAYDKPSVLIPRKGSLDRVYYVEEPFWNVDTIFYTEINEQKIMPKYLYYFLSSKHLEELNQAAGIPSLNPPNYFLEHIESPD